MKITVIGEICEDIFIYGDVIKLCPEAPVPVLVPKQVIKNSGMAGNVANNLKSLDNNLMVQIVHQNNSIFKTRFIDQKSNQMILRIDEGDNETIALEFSDEIDEALNDSDVVIISDYNKGFLTDNVIVQITKKSKYTIIDTKRNISDKIAKSVNFIKVNELEYLRNKKILDKYLDKLIVTLGKSGAKYKNVEYPIDQPKDTIDVSGAGDTFLASFILKFIETKNIESSIKFANEMSSIVVSKRGVTVPYEIIETSNDTLIQMLPNEINYDNIDDVDNKIIEN